MSAEETAPDPPVSASVYVIGGSGSTLGFINDFRGERGTITARLVPVAWTPVGVMLGDTWQNVGIALAQLPDWMDRSFPPEDERAFVAPIRDIELLARVGWNSELPEALDDTSVLNLDDLPDEIGEALAAAPANIVQCAACRRLCVRDDFVWKEKQLCAWDFHAQVFGKRGPWHSGAYEERHFETIPSCAYVASALLADAHADVVLATDAIDDALAKELINRLLDADAARSYMAVKTGDGYTVLRER